MRYKLGVLGVGVMGGGLLNNIVTNIESTNLTLDEIIIFDTDFLKLSIFKNLGVAIANSIDYMFENCELLILGIKPQSLKQICNHDFKRYPDYIISIMAGVKLEKIKDCFTQSKGYIRIMPNLPCLIGEGNIGICSLNVDDEILTFTKSLFLSCGSIFDIKEDKFDALTSISGSGPAYMFFFANSLINAGIEMGLSPEVSRKLTFNTMIGSAKYASTSTLPLEQLIKDVCSKGGTTIEAINVFEEKNLSGIIQEGLVACRDKSILLSDLI